MLVEIGLPVCGICSVPCVCTRAALQLKKCKGKSESESTERDSGFQVCLSVALGFFVSLGCFFFCVCGCLLVLLVGWFVSPTNPQNISVWNALKRKRGRGL